MVSLLPSSLCLRQKRLPGKKLPLCSAGLHALRDEYTGTIALTANALALERTLSDLVNQAYGLTAAEIALMWQTARPRMRPVVHSSMPRKLRLEWVILLGRASP